MPIHDKSYAIGLDLGGTKILASLLDQTGNVLYSLECDTRADEGAASVIERVCSAIEQVAGNSRVAPSEICGVGIATAGVVDSKARSIIYAHNIGLQNVPVGDIISERFGFSVKIGNDANLAAVAEWTWGSGRGKEHVIYITVSTGIGAGIISGGRLITGVTDNAGEFGHMSVDYAGEECPCGNYGCLEMYASGTAIAKRAQRWLTEGQGSKFFSRRKDVIDTITAKEVGDAARKGDAFAIQLLREAGTYLGVAVTNLIHLFNPEVIAFGGSVMNLDDLLLPTIQQTVAKRCIPAMEQKVSLVRSALGSEACVKGAAALLFTPSTVTTLFRDTSGGCR